MDAGTLRHLLDDGGEIALLDVREEGVYARDGHILLAANLPLSHLELRVAALLPRKTVRIVVCDGGEGLAQRAAGRLLELGYLDVKCLEGGAQGWAAAGFRLYTGVYVPSKAFGEYVLHHDRTPEVTAAELHGWLAARRDMVIVDSRPLDEYRRNSIPGAIDCTASELVYRIHDLVPSHDTVVVVNCGGRTRSIIGAQALINAGLPNPVYALKDGTQGWHLAGYPLEHGRTDAAPVPSAAGAERARADAAQVARRYGVRTTDAGRLRSLQADASRTVYLIDVRSPEEFLAGHVPGSQSVPGVQLVQATDVFLAVRQATVVLIDDNGARATMTAAWLMQMGWHEVFVLENALEDITQERGPARVDVTALAGMRTDFVTPETLHGLLADPGAQVIDLATSLQYSEGHVPGAWHVVRARLPENLSRIPAARQLVVTAPDDALACLAAHDAAGLTSAAVAVLKGGTAAWSAAGYPLEKGTGRFTGPDDDMRYKALDRRSDVEGAIREYLQWEVDLVNATESDRDFGFRRFA